MRKREISRSTRAIITETARPPQVHNQFRENKAVYDRQPRPANASIKKVNLSNSKIERFTSALISNEDLDDSGCF